MPTSHSSRKRVAVLGGGIAGLAAAYTLARARQAGAPVEELLIEGRDRLGGVIHTERLEALLSKRGRTVSLPKSRKQQPWHGSWASVIRSSVRTTLSDVHTSFTGAVLSRFLTD